MKNRYSNIFTFSKKILTKTLKLLTKGHIVALPTETVYGLAGNAYSNLAIKKIYKLKGRPKINPLIIHYYNINKASEDFILNNNFEKLYKRLCPGAITFVLKKKKNSKINPLASANLNTVAVRFPKHRVTRAILKKIDFPLAMPSANISSSVSPICAQDVFDEFKKKIKFIINGGKSKIGIESTVIDLTNSPKILRPGIISNSKIEKILRLKIKKNINKLKINAPGMLKKHYSPGIPVLINQSKFDNDNAIIFIGNKFKNKSNFFSLSKNSNLNEAASNLYKTFRLIKKKGFKKIQITKIPNRGAGIAINDRIKRAASKI
ncbi:L-threonylcarbamoyladenylate synthase [Pelagibacteraceae bacterium]|jgi:L-threonylcarbamoyladenylate synthase|nr:L-threonylcarbamoyladenylate synthase [Pelagibacteraceae bacterium]MDC1158069.1 L-threonylcarbamoyladenylate synthase [Pelagibacteraceae bacterium]